MVFLTATENENGKVQRKLVTQTEHLSKVMVEFGEDMVSPTKQSTLFEHLFVTHWQFHMYSMIKNNLLAGHILQVIDFAKNRSTLYESEVKSSFFNPTQITMHSIITFYNSSAGLDSNYNLVHVKAALARYTLLQFVL